MGKILVVPTSKLAEVSANKELFLGSPWTPVKITTAAWFDASDSDTITDSGGNVSQWDDKSSNGNDLTQGTGVNQPQTGTKAIGGLNAIEFDAVNYRIGNGSISGLPTSDIDVFTVFKPDTTTEEAWTLRNTGASNEFRHENGGGYGYFVATSAGIQQRNTAQADNDAHIANLRWSGSNVQEFKDGTQIGSDDPLAGTFDVNDEFFVGANVFNQPKYDGAIGEIIITAYLSDSDRQKVEGYLAWKWGLTANLPSDHSYKNTAP